MQYTKWVCAAVLMLYLTACSSNQIPEAYQQQDDINNNELSSIPKDGKLRTAHVRMYVAVKIKQEQLRHEAQPGQSVNQAANLPNNTYRNVDNAFEKAAIEHFEFESDVYYWAKNKINDTLINYTDDGSTPLKTMSNIGNPVIAHNLSILKKFKDELRFASQYKLEPKLLTTSSSVVTKKPST